MSGCELGAYVAGGGVGELRGWGFAKDLGVVG